MENSSVTEIGAIIDITFDLDKSEMCELVDLQLKFGRGALMLGARKLALEKMSRIGAARLFFDFRDLKLEEVDDPDNPRCRGKLTVRRQF